MLEVPSEIEGHKVTSVGPLVFSCCESLTEVTLPDSVTSLGEEVLSGCNNLKNVIVDKGSYAEEYCMQNNIPCTCPDANS